MTYPQVFMARWADRERIQTARMAKLWKIWRYLHNLKVFYTLNTIILQILFLFTKRFYCQKKNPGEVQLWMLAVSYLLGKCSEMKP